MTEKRTCKKRKKTGRKRLEKGDWSGVEEKQCLNIEESFMHCPWGEKLVKEDG